MVKRKVHAGRGSALGRALARRDERGMAVMVVVLVIMMLSGIGIFATRAASLTTASAGSLRQMSQTHYVTEYAMQATFAELSSDRQPAYIQLMANPASPNNDPANPQCQGLANAATKTCLKLSKVDLEKIIVGQFGLASTYLVNAAQGSVGSLGKADTIANFAIEITDLSPVASPVAGSDITNSGGAGMSYYQITVSATGIVVPNSDPSAVTESFADLSTWQKQAASTLASQELSRAHLIVGPLPAKL
jgi:hypothetical protein